jgi:hypothetical protein
MVNVVVGYDAAGGEILEGPYYVESVGQASYTLCDENGDEARNGDFIVESKLRNVT